MYPHAEGAQHGKKQGDVDMSGELAIKHAPDGSIVISHKPEAAPEMAGEPASLKTVTAKVQPVALTAVGAAVGLGVGGPIGLAVGVGIGGMIDWIRHRQKKENAAADAAASSTAVQLPPNLANVHLKPITIAAISKAAPPAYPKLKLIKIAVNANLATHPATVNPDPNTVAAKNAADALYGYFQQYPFDRMLGDVFWKANKTGILVKAFQAAYNADSATNSVTGPLSVTGFYDAKTAGALTFYTHNPVDPDPNA